jgi:hypothetical protein
MPEPSEMILIQSDKDAQGIACWLISRGTRINQIVVEAERAKSLGNSEVLIPGNGTNPSILKTDTPPQPPSSLKSKPLLLLMSCIQCCEIFIEYLTNHCPLQTMLIKTRITCFTLLVLLMKFN